MVRVSVSFVVPPPQKKAFKTHFQSAFLPAISSQRGFMECLLLSPDDTPESCLRLDITFASSEEQRAWVADPLHDQVFGPLSDLAETVEVERLTVS
jgi:hypothetical protein